VGQPADEHVVEHAEPLDQVELLIDHADLGAVRLQRRAPQRIHVLAAAADHAFRRDEGAREAPDERRLPRPRAADDSHELPGLHRDGDPVQSELIAESPAHAVENHPR
jgi:hypothetical protein